MWKDAGEALVEIGAIFEEIESQLADSHETFRKHWFTGAANVFTTVGADQQGLIDPCLRRIAAEGAGFTLLEYLAAVKEREAMATAMNLFYEPRDVLLSPPLPQPAL